MKTVDSNGLHQQIRCFILEKFPAAKKRGLNEEVPLLERGIVDSLGVLDVIGFLEKTFQIKIDDDELTPDNFATVSCMAALVERKTSAELTAKSMSPFR